MHIEKVMTAPVITVDPATSIAVAVRMMLDRHISGLPVVTGAGVLVGMVSEGDFLRRVELDTERKRSWWNAFLVGPGVVATDYVRAHGRLVGEIMSKDVAMVASQATLDDAVALMTRRHVRRLPVVDDGRVVGIVTRSDLLRALSRALAGQAIGLATDRQIEAAILAELNTQAWNAGRLISVRVENGVAELRGTIFDERERPAARVAAENVPGVTRVVDRLVWIEPVSGLVLPAAGDGAEP